MWDTLARLSTENGLPAPSLRLRVSRKSRSRVLVLAYYRLGGSGSGVGGSNRGIHRKQGAAAAPPIVGLEPRSTMTPVGVGGFGCKTLGVGSREVGRPKERVSAVGANRPVASRTQAQRRRGREPYGCDQLASAVAAPRTTTPSMLRAAASPAVVRDRPRSA